MRVNLMQNPWYGDSTLDLELPADWDVTICGMGGEKKPPLKQDQIISAIRNPIGTKPLSKLAEGKKEVAIIFDDMTRPTKIFEVVPFIIEELKKGGISEDHIRFICANGAHGTYNREDFSKKLGEKIIEEYPVFNHNPYSNLNYLGHTKHGTPVEVNAEVMSCDLKIGIGGIAPHPQFGFGGGAKIILPGISSIRTISFNHGDLGGWSSAQNYRDLHPTCQLVYGRLNAENLLRQDSEEAAKMAGIDMVVNFLFDFKRNSTDIFAGDIVEAQRKGVEEAITHYRTQIPQTPDLVISNAYSKASESAIASWPSVIMKEGGTLVIVCNTPSGQVSHYVHGRWGINRVGGNLWLPPPGILNRVGKVIFLSQYPEKQPWLEMSPPEKTINLKTWEEALEEIKNTLEGKPRVAVFPDATLQKPF
ncbi:MAG: lactate racemase domain-containing protein [Candidatus Jordarchaeaceae archaeon]